MQTLRSMYNIGIVLVRVRYLGVCIYWSYFILCR